jgi:hypothetical protein
MTFGVEHASISNILLLRLSEPTARNIILIREQSLDSNHVPHFLRNLKVYVHVHKGTKLVHILRQINPVYTLLLILSSYLRPRSPDSSVDIATSRTAGGSNPVRSKMFSSPVSSPALGPTHQPIHCVPGAIFSGVKRPWREAGYIQCRVLECWSHTSTQPYVIKRWETLAFFIYDLVFRMASCFEIFQPYFCFGYSFQLRVITSDRMLNDINAH